MPGIPLSEVVEAAARRGLRLPLFLRVTLVQGLAAQLALAHGRGDGRGAVSLETVELGFDGVARPLAWGLPGDDVRAAATLLAGLPGEAPDDELARVISEAADFPAPLVLEQRLGHWLVKQRQLLPGHDLPAEFMAWLFPQRAPEKASEVVTAWLDGECRASPLLPPPTPRVARRPVTARLVLSLVGAVLGTGVMLNWAVHGLPERPPPPSARVVTPPPPPPVPALARTPEVQVAPSEPEPALPRWVHGAPAQAELSSRTHGVDLARAGFAVQGPGPRWALQTRTSNPRTPPPPYAALFAATFDPGGGLREVTQVNSKTWANFTAPSVRVFAMQPDVAPDEGSFGLAVAKVSGQAHLETFASTRADVLTEAMTQQETRRLVVDGLVATNSYVVVQRRVGSNARVIATATVSSRTARSMRALGFQRKDTPLDQVLLEPGVPVEVKGVTRVSFVVLTTSGAPEQRAWVEVFERGRTAGTGKVNERGDVRSLEQEGTTLLLQRNAGASFFFERCLRLEPGNPECLEKLRRAYELRP